MPGRAPAEAELGQASRLPDQCCDQLRAAAISQPVAAALPGCDGHAAFAVCHRQPCRSVAFSFLLRRAIII